MAGDRINFGFHQGQQSTVTEKLQNDHEVQKIFTFLKSLSLAIKWTIFSSEKLMASYRTTIHDSR